MKRKKPKAQLSPKHLITPTTVLWLTLVYAALLAAISALNWLGNIWWLGALNLYLPQAIWMVPGLVLVVLAWKVARKWSWVPLLCVVWVLVPIMGFCWPLPSRQPSAQNERFRVMTWNIKYCLHDQKAHWALIYEIDWQKPDVVLLQEIDDPQELSHGPLGSYFTNWNFRSYGQFLIASRFPLAEDEARWIPVPGQKEKYNCLRCLMRIGGRKVTLYSVHFESPRYGLNAFRAVTDRPSYLPGAIQRFQYNVQTRLFQARALQQLLKEETGPVIVAGDFNSSDTSRVCAELRNAGLHDAFAQAGKGYGYTYGHDLLQHRIPWLRFSWMRIDHIMLSSQLQAERSWTGTKVASEHRPVIADLILNGSK